MGVREGLLALLRGQPKHGYQLRGEFEQVTGQMWPLNIGQVYASLQRLERDDLIGVDHHDVVDRKSYRITDDGVSALRRWLLEPVPRDGERRDEVTMKLLMAEASGAADVRDVIAVQRGATMHALQGFTHHKARVAGDEFATLVQLDRLILRCRAELDWLEMVEARVDARAGRRDAPIETQPREEPT